MRGESIQKIGPLRCDLLLSSLEKTIFLGGKSAQQFLSYDTATTVSTHGKQLSLLSPSNSQVNDGAGSGIKKGLTTTIRGGGGRGEPHPSHAVFIYLYMYCTVHTEILYKAK